MGVRQEVVAQVRITLEGLWEAYGRGDLEEILGYFAPEEGIVGLGTGADERNLGWAEHRAQIQRDLAQSESRRVEITWFKAEVAGEVAWAATEWDYTVTAGGRRMSGRGRATYVLRLNEGRWLIVQSHSSLPAGGQQAGQSFPEAGA